jgi:hypothetical protein
MGGTTNQVNAGGCVEFLLVGVMDEYFRGHRDRLVKVIVLQRLRSSARCMLEEQKGIFFSPKAF